VRIDVVSIFPDYLAPLGLSLVGKAQASGLLDVRVHDLRRWTNDRHHTTDDTPYGGGAGMVMRPQPWGEALDELIADGATGERPTLVVPTPSGRPFTQALAHELSTRRWLLFACGRYEGIDQRVVDHFTGSPGASGDTASLDVVEVSIGDYVLNGGEVAALVVVEAVARLLPGFMGNPESLFEESHNTGEDGGLLEYPVYTKPANWRGHEVPPVLLSGDHARITAWRREQAVRRTAQRRPDLLHGSRTVVVADLDALVRTAVPADAEELFTLQRACWLQEAQANDDLSIPPLTESLAELRASLESWTTFVVRAHGRLVASVRARVDPEAGDRWDIGRIMVAPDLQGRGVGRWLLEYAEAAAPDHTRSFTLFTGSGSADNLRMYRRAGYRPLPPDPDSPGTVRLVKRRRR